MNTFIGSITFQNSATLAVHNDNICLRGSQLQNTEFVYLLAVYTGHDTKILQSMNAPPSKKSTI